MRSNLCQSRASLPVLDLFFGDVPKPVGIGPTSYRSNARLYELTLTLLAV